MPRNNGGHRNGSPDAADTLTPTRLAEIGGSIGMAQVQELRKMPSALPSQFAPGQAASFTSTPLSNTSVQLAWTAPSDNGGSAILGYKIKVKLLSGGTLYESSGYDTSPYTVTGMTAGQTYVVGVSAVNANGQGDLAYVQANPSVVAPGAPTALSATAGRVQAALSWTAPASDGGSAITGYVIEYTPSGGSASTTGNGGTSSTSFTLGDPLAYLTGGTQYSVRVAATNLAGMGPYSSATTVTPTGPIITIANPPVAQTAISGAAAFSVYAVITDDATLSYQWQRQALGTGGYSNVSGATSATLSLSSLTSGSNNGDNYQCVVSGSRGADSVTSNSATLTVSSSTPVITITTQPVNATMSNGNFSFSVVATTTSGTLTYQWQHSTGLGSSTTWSNISGATSTTYSKTQQNPSDTQLRWWRCVVSCTGATSVTSAERTIASTPTPTWYGYFYNPDAAFQAVFGSVSATSGSASSKLSASLNGFDGPIVVYTANAGTLRITGTIDGDGPFDVSGTSGPGGNDGYNNLAVNFSLSVYAGQQIYFTGSYLVGNLQMWLVPN